MNDSINTDGTITGPVNACKVISAKKQEEMLEYRVNLRLPTMLVILVQYYFRQ